MTGLILMDTFSKFRLDKGKISLLSFAEAAEEDKNYWLSRPVEERFEALEFTRQVFFGYTDETAPRLQRFFEFVDKTQD